MAEIQLQRVRGFYGEIAGIFEQVLLDGEKKVFVVYRQTGEQYNIAVDELSAVSGTDYSRYKLSPVDQYSESAYVGSVARAKIGSLVKRLEQEYRFGTNASSTGGSAPVIVTINNDNKISISVTPIQQLIESVDDEAIRQNLEDLKHAVETSKDQKATSSILNSLQQKSWEVFIKVLPFVLEKWGHLHK